MRRAAQALCTAGLRAGVVAALILAWPSSAVGWKIETHVWIAQQVLNDLLATQGTRCAITLPVRDVNPDGTVSIVSREYLVEQAICDSLARYPQEYRIGSLGPDTFPDLVGGQLTTHPGVPGGWTTDRWLEWVLAGALRPSSGAASHSFSFAYGFLTHAAGDAFAHTYVNSYSGDIFDLEIGASGGEQHVELRHMALEGYLKAHTPPLLGPSGASMGRPEDTMTMTVPLAEFIRDRLILNAEVAAQYDRQPTTKHLKWMYDHWKKLGDGIQEINNLLAAVNGEITLWQNQVNALQDQIDEVKDRTIKLPFVGRVKIYPASCFLEPTSCALVLTLEATLRITNLSLDLAKRANSAAAASVREPLELWRRQVETAVTQYVITSHEVANSLMKADLNLPESERAVAKVQAWLCRYGPVFGAIPAQLSGLGCTAAEHATNLASGIADLYQEFSGSTVAWLIDPIGAAGERIRQEIGDHVLGELTTALLDNNATLRSLATLRETTIDAAALNHEFSYDPTAKSLLTFSNVSSLVDADMGITAPGQTFSPTQFHAMHDAILLSKLLLLAPAELNRLASDNGVNVTIYGDSLYVPPPVRPDGTSAPFNVLFEAVRSIDGNHQWQQFALPYPRRIPGVDIAAHEYGYGFTPAERRGGFRFWQDCEARVKVFERLFKGPVAPALSPIVLPLDANWESANAPFPFSPWSLVREPAKLVWDETLGSNVFLCGGAPPEGTAWIAPPPGYVPPLPPDRMPPTLIAPPNVTAECNAGGAMTQVVALGEAIAVDDRDGVVPVENNAPPSFSIYGGSARVDWWAVDSAGNAAGAIQTVRVVDTEPPRFIDVADRPDAQGRYILNTRLRYTATSSEGATVTIPPPDAMDACHGPTVSFVVQPSDGRVLSRLDDFANVSWQVVEPPYTIPVGRTYVPWMTAYLDPRTWRLELSVAWQIVDVSALRGDLNIDGHVDGADVTLLLAEVGGAVSAPVLRDFDDDGDVDEIDRGVFDLMVNGNSDPRDLTGDLRIDVMDVRELVRIWIPVDTAPPALTCPATMTVSNDPGLATAAVTYPAASALDNYPGVLMSSAPASGSVFAVGNNTVTATATDAHGNSSTCTFQIIVQDVEPPVISCPAAIMVPNDRGAAGAVVGFAPAATDNVPGVQVATSPLSGSFFALGETTVQATATDAAVLTATCSFSVTVNDTEPPAISAPSPVTAEATGPDGAIVPDTALGSAVAADNSGSVTVGRFGVPSGNLFPLGTTTLRYVATDPSGNSAEVLQLVNVVDTTPPVITVRTPAAVPYKVNEVVLADYGCSDLVTGVVACSSPAAANGQQIDTASAGVKTFTVTATDGAGNSSTATVTYSVTYNVCLLYGTGRAAKAGSTLPIKLQLCDVAGANLSSVSTVLTANQLLKISDQTNGEVTDAGQANPDNDFRFDLTLGGTGGYIFNLSTQGLSAGTYVMVFSASGDPHAHGTEVVFQVR